MVAHPQDPDCLLTTVSDGPNGDNVHGQLHRTDDAGRTWSHISEGLPQSTRDNIDTFHVAFDADGTAWAGVGRELFVGTEKATEWSKCWGAPDEIAMVACRRPI